MPNIRLRFADDLPLIIPGHSFRFLAEIRPGKMTQFPAAKALLLYDLGDNAGPQSAVLATSPEVVVEVVGSDPRFMGRIIHLNASDGGIWVLPQHQNGISGFKPPSDEEIAEIDRTLAAAEEALAAFSEERADAERPRIEQLRTDAANRKSFAGMNAKLNLVIPSVVKEQHFVYFVAETADEVDALLNPEPVQQLERRGKHHRRH